jgi:hypothetical protein
VSRAPQHGANPTEAQLLGWAQAARQAGVRRGAVFAAGLAAAGWGQLGTGYVWAQEAWNATASSALVAAESGLHDVVDDRDHRDDRSGPVAGSPVMGAARRVAFPGRPGSTVPGPMSPPPPGTAFGPGSAVPEKVSSFSSLAGALAPRPDPAPEVLAPLQRVRVRVAGDGDCFYRAFMATARPANVGGIPEDVAGLRAMLAEMARSPQVQDQNVVPGPVLQAAITAQVTATAQALGVSPQHLQAQWTLAGEEPAGQALRLLRGEIRTPGSWDNHGGELVPYLAAAYFNVQIQVVQANGHIQMIGTPGRPVITLYRPTPHHWDATAPLTATAAPATMTGPGSPTSGPGHHSSSRPGGHGGSDGYVTRAYTANVDDAAVNGLRQTIKDLEEQQAKTGPDPKTEQNLRTLREQLATYPGQNATGTPAGTAHIDHDPVTGIDWVSSTHSAYTPTGTLIPDHQRACVSIAVLTR